MRILQELGLFFPPSFGIQPTWCSQAGKTVQYAPDSDSLRVSLLPRGETSLKNRIFMDESKRGVSNLCGLI